MTMQSTMKQREVQDSKNVRWTCVQALSGVKEISEKKAAEAAGVSNGQVEVVCTPSGGAQTVRITLPVSWEDELDDAELLSKIEKHAG
jgi:hypothetical protein